MRSTFGFCNLTTISVRLLKDNLSLSQSQAPRAAINLLYKYEHSHWTSSHGPIEITSPLVHQLMHIVVLRSCDLPYIIIKSKNLLLSLPSG